MSSISSELKVELTARALFLLMDVLEQYIAEGYEAAETVEQARTRLADLDKQVREQKPL